MGADESASIILCTSLPFAGIRNDAIIRINQHTGNWYDHCIRNHSIAVVLTSHYHPVHVLGLHRRLVSLMTEMERSQEDREQVNRLWVIFISGLENIQQDLHKASDLINLFPLSQKKDRRALVNTGVSDSVSGVAALAASVQTPWLTVQVEQSPDLKTHITQVDTLLKEMLQKVSVPFWSVESTQQAWVESGCQEDSHDNHGTLEEMMEVESQDSKMSACCHPPNCKLRCMFCLLH